MRALGNYPERFSRMFPFHKGEALVVTIIPAVRKLAME